MPKATGSETGAALRRASSWGSPVEVGAGHGLLVLPHTIKKDVKTIMDDSLGGYFPSGADVSEVKVEGSLPMYMRYDGIALPLALCLGITGGAPVQQGSTAAYAQSFLPSASIEGLFATLALYNKVNVEEFPSVKFTGFTLRGEIGRALEIKFNCIADDMAASSQVNTPATFAAVTNPWTGSRVLMSQGAFRINDASGAALGEVDEIFPSAFELEFKRPMKGAYAVGSAGNTIDEPLADAPAEISLRLEFPRYSSQQHFDGWQSGALLKMDAVFTGAEIEAPYARQFGIEFPLLGYATVEAPVSKGAFTHSLRFNCLASSSAPAGMSGITTPFRINTVGLESADVLA